MSVSQMRGTEYFPLPVAISGAPALVVASPKERKSGNNSGPGSPFGSSIGFGGRSAATASLSPAAAPLSSMQLPQFQAPYLQSVRVSKEVVIYKPPPFLTTRLSKMPPVISVQTELNATNFHEVAKSAVVDPVTQLNIPTWELRNPAPEELHAEKEFEAQESQWEDEYWKEVARFRQRLEINSKASEKGLASPLSTGRRSEKSFQRGDSFRIDARVPTSPIGPTQAPVLRRSSTGRKPPLPQAARATTTKKDSSSQQKSSSTSTPAVSSAQSQPNAASSMKEDSAVSQRTSSGPATVIPINLPPPNPTTPTNEEPLTAPSTPIHMDLLHRQQTASHSTPEHPPLEPGRSASSSAAISSIFVRPHPSGEDSPQPKAPSGEREHERETESMTPPPLPRGGSKMDAATSSGGPGTGGRGGGVGTGDDRIMMSQGLSTSDTGLGSSLDGFGSVTTFPVTKFRFHVRPSLEAMSWNIVLPHFHIKANALPSPQPPVKEPAAESKPTGAIPSSASQPNGGKTTSPSTSSLAPESTTPQQGGPASTSASASKGQPPTKPLESSAKTVNQDAVGKENIKPSNTTAEPSTKGECKPADGPSPTTQQGAKPSEAPAPAPQQAKVIREGSSQEEHPAGTRNPECTTVTTNGKTKGVAPSQSTEPIPTESTPEKRDTATVSGDGKAKELRTEPIDTDPTADENPKPSRGCCSMM